MGIERRITLSNVTDRRSLLSELDLALGVHGGRIAAGTYEVTIRRLTKREAEALRGERRKAGPECA